MKVEYDEKNQVRCFVCGAICGINYRGELKCSNPACRAKKNPSVGYVQENPHLQVVLHNGLNA